MFQNNSEISFSDINYKTPQKEDFLHFVSPFKDIKSPNNPIFERTDHKLSMNSLPKVPQSIFFLHQKQCVKMIFYVHQLIKFRQLPTFFLNVGTL